MKLYDISTGIPRQIKARPARQPRPHGLAPVTVYRTDTGRTIAARHVKTWDDLTPAQKEAAQRADAEKRTEAARWEAKKDPTLRDLAEKWIEEARK